MKTKLRTRLEEADKDQLLDILSILLEKNKSLNEEIEYILDPKKLKYPQSYYNKQVKRAIDTNSWSKFPNKGVKGLQKCLEKVRFFESIRNNPEAEKLARAVLDTIFRCKKNYNNQNVEDLNTIKAELKNYWLDIDKKH